MSELLVDTIKDAAGTGSPSFPNGSLGKTDGSGVGPGEIGEYLRAFMSSIFAVTADDTDTDVTGLSIAVTPGVWLIGYDVMAGWSNDEATTKVGALRLKITNSSNVVLPDTVQLIRHHSLPASAVDYRHVHAQAHLNISSGDTYKVRVAKGGSGGSPSMAVRVAGGVSVDSLLTDPDTRSLIWALRIA